MESLSAEDPAADEALKERLEKLQAQGALSQDEAAYLKGTLHEKKASSKKVFWLRIVLGCALISGAVRSCQRMRQREAGLGQQVGQTIRGEGKASGLPAKPWQPAVPPIPGQDNVFKDQPGLK
jgi:hypothetical protein